MNLMSYHHWKTKLRKSTNITQTNSTYRLHNPENPGLRYLLRTFTRLSAEIKSHKWNKPTQIVLIWVNNPGVMRPKPKKLPTHIAQTGTKKTPKQEWFWTPPADPENLTIRQICYFGSRLNKPLKNQTTLSTYNFHNKKLSRKRLCPYTNLLKTFQLVRKDAVYRKKGIRHNQYIQ